MTRQAIVLAAGLGTRLAPLNLGVPKPMAPVHKHPFLEIQLNHLKRYGINDIVIGISRAGLAIRDFFGNGRKLGMNIVYSIERHPIGTATTLFYAFRLLHSSFYVINGDTAFNFNPLEIEKLSKAHSGIIISLVKKINTKRYGRIEINKSNEIKKFREKGISGRGFVFAGVAFVHKSAIVEYRHKTRYKSLESDIFPDLIKKDLLYGKKVKGDFWDIGTPSSYKQFCANKFKKFIQ